MSNTKTQEFLALQKKAVSVSEAVTGGKVVTPKEEPVEGEKVKETSIDDNLYWDVLLATLFNDDDDEEDSGSSAMRDLAKAMIHVHADLMMLYLQTRQHHWHVQGMIFRDIHLMFDEATEVILGCIDPLAERTVAMGAIVPTNPTTFMEISDIPLIEENVRDPKEMLAQSIDAIKEIMEDIADLNDLAAEQRETGIVNMIGGIAEDLEVLVYKYQQFLAVFGE